MAFQETSKGGLRTPPEGENETHQEKSENDLREEAYEREMKERQELRGQELHAIWEKRRETVDAGELFTLLSRSVELELEDFRYQYIGGRLTEDSEHLPRVLGILAKEFGGISLTEVQKTLVLNTVEGIKNRTERAIKVMKDTTWRPRDLGAVTDDYELVHGINVASLQLYSFLQGVQDHQKSRG